LPEVDLGKGAKMSLTPKFEVSYVGEDFYQDDATMGVARLGVDAEIAVKKWSIIMALNRQIDLDGDRGTSLSYGSIGLKRSF
jgi:hypothetical protein